MTSECSRIGRASQDAPNAAFSASRDPRPTVGAVFEGGGFRGLYTAGVIDVWLERGVVVDHAVGVSAGAAFGCNIKSRQIGRAIRYNKRFCADKRYASLGNLIRTGDLYSKDFAYGEVPWVYDPFDTAAFTANPMRFTVVCTDVDTGEALYHDLGPGDADDIEWIRASASIPALSRPVHLDGRAYLDGGVADSIPWEWMAAQGYEREVVVLTQPAGYRKEPNSLMPLLRVLLCRYPRLLDGLATRHDRYNACLDSLAAQERAGRVFVIRPSESVKVPAICRDPDELERIYQVGRADAERTLPGLLGYLGQS